MSRYMEVAAQANETALALMKLVGSDRQGEAAELVARLVNFGVRCAPRAVHSTVRLNAVKRAVQGLPVRVSMKQVTDPKTKRTYNALVTEPVGGVPNMELSDWACED